MPESALDEVVTWERGDDDVLRVVLQRPPANALGLPPDTQQDYLTPWTAAKAEKRFLERFKTLCP